MSHTGLFWNELTLCFNNLHFRFVNIRFFGDKDSIMQQVAVRHLLY